MSRTKLTFNVAIRALMAVLAVTCDGSSYAQTPGNAVSLRPAERVASPEQVRMLSATRAGTRIVAVGDRGVVILSDDNGSTFRQARMVPTSSSLTSVTFTDPSHGWAVGHWGVIVATNDGGETWQLQRSD